MEKPADNYLYTSLNKDGETVQHCSINARGHCISHIRALFEQDLDDLYFGNITNIIIQRIPRDE